jgi:hypothetical protein
MVILSVLIQRTANFVDLRPMGNTAAAAPKRARPATFASYAVPSTPVLLMNGMSDTTT